MFVLSLCVVSTQALEHVVFDGNPIGEQGAKTLMVSENFVSLLMMCCCHSKLGHI